MSPAPISKMVDRATSPANRTARRRFDARPRTATNPMHARAMRHPAGQHRWSETEEQRHGDDHGQSEHQDRRVQDYVLESRYRPSGKEREHLQDAEGEQRTKCATKNCEYAALHERDTQ